MASTASQSLTLAPNSPPTYRPGFCTWWTKSAYGWGRFADDMDLNAAIYVQSVRNAKVAGEPALWFGPAPPLGYAAIMPNLRFFALALVTCSSAALAMACGGDDVAAVPDASGNDATSDTGTNDTGTNDTGTNDTGTNDTGTNDTGTGDGGTDGSPATGIVCAPTNCAMATEACCAPKGGTDTCAALPDAGNFQRVCAVDESEFRCSSTDMCGGGGSRCCARLPKTFGDGGPEYTATCNTQGCVTNGQFTAIFLCTPNGKYDCGDAGTCKALVQLDGGPAIPPGYYACQP